MQVGGGGGAQEDAECNGSEFGEPSSDSGCKSLFKRMTLIMRRILMLVSLQVILMAVSDSRPGFSPNLDLEEGKNPKASNLHLNYAHLRPTFDCFQVTFFWDLIH